MFRIVLPVEELQSLWIVDEDILAENGQPLVRRGAVVTPSLKAAMLRHGIERVRVRPDEEVEGLDWTPGEILPPALAFRARRKIQELFSNTVRKRALSPQLLSEVAQQTSDVIDRLFEGDLPLFAELRSLSDFDGYTHEHCWSVLLISIALARAAQETGVIENLHYQDCLSLGLGAVLHDIGKTQLPRPLLQKAGPLDDDEWKLMRLHPQKGIDLLRPYDLLMPLSRAIVAFHHERIDGGGYGLAKGHTLAEGIIPETVRIVSIADAYDAMVSARPYRRAFLPYEALDILAAEAGRQFDDRLVPLMEEIVVAFPAGSLLLLKDGTVATVRSPGDHTGKRPLPECLVVAAFSDAALRHLGASMTLESRSQVILGAVSPDDLIACIAQTQNLNPASLPPPLRENPFRLAGAIPLWDELLTHEISEHFAATPAR